MNTRYPLTATVREAGGHKSNHLRKEAAIPATVYGKGKDSLSLAVNNDAFMTVYKKARETHIVDLTINGKTQPVLIHTVQRHPVKNVVTHVEFLTVNLSEKLKTSIPVHIAEESPAVTEGKGMLITTLQEIEIECLPTNIPESLIVGVSHLTEVDQEIKVSQLTAPQGVTILSDPELTVIKVGAIVVEQEAPTPTAEGEQPSEETSTDAAPVAEEPKKED